MRNNQYFIVVLIILNTGCNNTNSKSPPPIGSIEGNSVYLTYDFRDNDSIIYFGYQPLYLPTSIITELIIHDNVLKNELKKLHQSVSFYPFFKGYDVNQFLFSKKIQVGIGGDMPAINAALSNRVIIASMIQNGYTSVLVKGPLGINSLNGKRIGYAYGSNAHYTLLKALEAENVKKREYSLQPIDANDMIDAIRNEKINAIAVWEPTTTIALKEFPQMEIIFRYVSSGFLYFDKEEFEHNQRAYKLILAAQIRAMNWIHKSEGNLFLACELTIKRIEDFTGDHFVLSAPEVAAIAKNDIFHTSNIGLFPGTLLSGNSPLYNEFLFINKLNVTTDEKSWKDVKQSFRNDIIRDIIKHTGLYSLETFDYNF
jgi:sulfonate transport system substrate-binding protein